MPVDYSKWDSIEDSDEELKKEQELKKSERDDDMPRRAQAASELSRWLKQRFRSLAREEAEEHSRNHFSSGYGMPSKPPPAPPDLTEEERNTLSNFVVLQHAPEGEHNLEQHVEMLECIRHNRWLCSNKTVNILCRLHNQLLRQAGKNNGRGSAYDDYDEDCMPGKQSKKDQDYREQIFTCVNTLCAPLREKCSAFEFISEICTPETDRARERRRKYQEKQYGKDALFDTLCGDLNLKDPNEDEDEDGWTDFWLFCGIFVIFAVIIIVAIIMLWYNNKAGSRAAKRLANLTANATKSVAAAAAAAPGAAAAAAADAGIGKPEL